MAIVEALQSVQYVINDQGQRTAVLMKIGAWETLTEWLETAIDTKIATQALAELHAAGGRPQQADWLAWDNISEAWDGDQETQSATKLKDGVVLLAQCSKAAPVLIAVEEWDRQAKRLQELEWREKAREALREAHASTKPDLSFDDFMTELRAYHERL